MRKFIYVAATSQHVGKTTTTLGLVAGLLNQGKNVGYCKPVGQQFLDINNLRVDKDTLLFSDLIDFELNPDLHSPIILGRGATQMYLDNPHKFNTHQKIMDAANKLSELHDIVIFEGTGHPGVGSVADVSNAAVAKLLNAGVVMVVEGGIGNTIDKLNLSLSLFREQNVPIIGVIINKIRPEKIEKIGHYVNKWLINHKLPLLGLIPYDQSLAHPLIKTVAKALKGKIVSGQDFINNKVEAVIAGSLVEYKELKKSQDLCLVTSNRSLHNAIRKISGMSETLGLTNSPLSGIVVTGKGKLNNVAKSYIDKHNIPIIQTAFDTYEAVLKISRIEVKINRSTPWKIKRAIELIEEHVDLDKITKL
jgi:dethiobiotin synthetase